LAPWRAPIARDKVDVSPVDTPTQQAIMKNSSGIDSPTAATAASPNVAAYTVSTKVKSDRIQKDSTRGAAIRKIDGAGTEVRSGVAGPVVWRVMDLSFEPPRG